ncbi:hypothetical protein N8850_00390 [Planktomarina temperata]|nr:hypothetical protein [Planktomarina temperata]
MTRIARHPPSRKTILLWIAVVGIALVLFGIERLIGWPDWLTVNSHRGGIGF